METTALAAPAAALTHVTIDDDATPVVRLIGRTLRDAVRLSHAADVLEQSSGRVVVRSHSTPQVATVVFDDGVVRVTGGVVAPIDATVTVDLDSRFAAVASDGDTQLADGLLRALHLPTPDWHDAAARFFELTREVKGIPGALVAVATGPDGPDEVSFGTGSDIYRVVGVPDALAGLFTGADFLLTALERGLCVQGTLAQLSTMTAASWKVRYDV